MLGTFTKCFLLSFLIEVTQTYIPSFSTQKKEPLNQGILKLLVEATGFEPATSASRTQRSTKLSHASSINDRYHITTQLGFQDLICGWMLIPEIFRMTECDL